jgi:pimeloyl-ACP methyl ester carboxylesterase
MTKEAPFGDNNTRWPARPAKTHWSRNLALASGLLLIAFLYLEPRSIQRQCNHVFSKPEYGVFPKKDDPFHFMPCTTETVPPALDDPKPLKSWAKLYDPDPKHWNWGGVSGDSFEEEFLRDPFSSRGIYMCGFLDVPLDYSNKSDTRISRLAVTKYQVSGLKPLKGKSKPAAGQKSERTLVIEPGGPGGSGTSMAWRKAQNLTRQFSGGRFDVLGWDPRGVNISQPSLACFPYNADRDRWTLLGRQNRQLFGENTRQQLHLMDAMNDATMRGCHDLYGDLPRFVTTALVARDLESIRIALGEDELTGYLVSYGTGIGQTYANMFPSSVGRMVLDGTEYVRDHRLLGGFGYTALDNITDAWHDGFLGECIDAGPENCALANPVEFNKEMSLKSLEARMNSLMESLIERPVATYSTVSGPIVITYFMVIAILYQSLYGPKTWSGLAQMFADLEAGNATLAAEMSEAMWQYNPDAGCEADPKPSSAELSPLTICSDAYDDPQPESGLDWWESLWTNMTQDSWIGGDSRFWNVFPCRHYTKYWSTPAEVYRGDLNNTLKNPVLLVAETYDPATPLRNGRRLLQEMGRNARLIVHHGYGHSSADTSTCTNAIMQNFILEGVLPKEQETDCYADEKPYRYDSAPSIQDTKSHVSTWRDHIEQLRVLSPTLF